MTVLAALLALFVAASVTFSEPLPCGNPIECPCGSTNINVTICPQTNDDPCREWLKCKKCESGQNACLECDDGYEGPQCSIPKKIGVKSRHKRQYPIRQPVFRTCPNLESPKLGSIRCETNLQGSTCVGKCLPGYSYEIYDAEEITLTCRDGSWKPMSSFPSCKSDGYCQLVVQGAGSFNCTTGIDGTRCDVFCARRYVGRYSCYPGQNWKPVLPHCVRPKERENQQDCQCLYGGTCDNFGNCLCPTGRTGTYCETDVSRTDLKLCRDPGHVQNGNRQPERTPHARGFLQGSAVEYSCNSGYHLIGESTIYCLTRGEWSANRPKCEPHSPTTVRPTELKFCRDPGEVPNGSRRSRTPPNTRGFPQGSSLEYSCNSGYNLIGDRTIYCSINGEWSANRPKCERQSPTPATPEPEVTSCRDPGDIPNGSRQPKRSPNGRFSPGSPIHFYCNSGFVLNGQSIIYCSISGDWSASRPNCEEQTPDCRNPGPIDNGKFVYYPLNDNRRRPPSNQDTSQSYYPLKSRLEYSCNDGYFLVGKPALICLKSGDWSAEPPICNPAYDEKISYCKNPGQIENGRVLYLATVDEPPGVLDDSIEEDMPQGSQLEYYCYRGYTLEGPQLRVCQESSKWDPEESPACVAAKPKNVYCKNPGFVLNGRVSYYPPAITSRNRQSPPRRDQDEFAEGTRLEYYCEDGYKLQGSGNLACQSTGRWSTELPVCKLDCGRSFVKSTTGKVIHGVETVNGEWPWVVALAIVQNNKSQIVCGGVVLNGKTVLTAAHCLARSSIFTLYFGKLHLLDAADDNEVMVRQSTRLIIHDKFNRSSKLDSDIGLIQFEPEVRFTKRIQPICLPTLESTASNLRTGNRGYATGWGLTEKHLQEDKLRMASLPYVSRVDCVKSYRKQNISLSLTDNMFCAGLASGRQSVCEGDSGSPFVFYSDDRYTVEGVVSFGVQGQCGLPGRYSVFTKVSRFIDWIRTNSKQT